MTEFVWPVRVYWEDTDAGGVVYYANYLKFLERARSEWLRSLGLEQTDMVAEDGVLFVVRRVEADYLRPARFNDALSVRSRLESLGKASLEMAQTIARGAEPILAARVKVACVGCRDFKPAKIPARVLEKFAWNCP
jgi:acyl-CoA thioester hydrolase